MAKFTKTYNTVVTEAQKKGLKRAFKTLTEGLLMMGHDVEVIVDNFDGVKIAATLFDNGFPLDQKLIGERGGVTTL